MVSSTGEKHIYPRGRKYQIQKNINGQTVYWGSYETIQEAIQVRNKLISRGWPKHDPKVTPTRRRTRGHGRPFPTLLLVNTNNSWNLRYYCPFTKQTIALYYSKYLCEIRRVLWEVHKLPYDELILWRDAHRKYRPHNHPLKYIQIVEYKDHYRYAIQKCGISYGSFYKLEDAIRERDLLVKCDWDEDLACEYQYDDGVVPVFPNRVRNIEREA